MKRFKIFAVLFIFSLFFSCKKYNQIQQDILDDEPPKNLYLADSPWPISHRNTYAQASSPLPGPDAMNGNIFVKDYKPLLPGLITLAISGEYSDGKHVIWGNTISTVFKAEDTGAGFNILATYQKPDVGIANLFSIDNAVSGAYTFVDKDNIFYVPKGYKLSSYTDAISDNRLSSIVLKNTFEIPINLRQSDERIVGLTLTYDGKIVFASNNGLIGLMNRDFTDLKYYQLPADEEISNSIACDENGGIYIVSSKKMYRVQWTGTELTTDEDKNGWIADYEFGGVATGIRLGQGSGSTPTLMGVGNQDKFVVITDGQDLMNVVLFWRDKIPNTWQQISGTKSNRIAAQFPVKFGNDNASKSLSEQLVCIRGNGILVVNNLLKLNTGNRLLDLLLSGIPQNAPYGAEKFEWNSTEMKLKSVWVNNSVSFPNGIPSMSAATNTIYNIGQKNGNWTFDGLDWTTGNLKFQYILGNQFNFNSAYAPTEIGLNGAIYSGTLLGVVGLWNK
jgi:hypothetical protein